MKLRTFGAYKKQLNHLRQIFRDLPRLIGNEYLNFYKDSWRRAGFIDKRFDKWLPRKKDKGVKRAILIKTGA